MDFNGNSIDENSDLSEVLLDTQNQTATPGVTTFSGTVNANIVLDSNLGQTGLLSGGNVTAIPGNTTFDVSAGTGTICFPTGINKFVTWTAKLNQSIYVGSYGTFVAIDQNGNIVKKVDYPFSAEERRTYIVLAEVSHANLAVIDYVSKSPYALYSGNQNLVDLSLALGILNLSGNIFSANGANLKVNKSAGSYFSIGANHSINPRNPNVLDRPQEITPLLYRFLRGGLTTVSTDIDPDFYDLNGVLTAMSNNHWQVQRFYMLGTLIGVAYGQVSYPNFADAFANYDKEIINGTQTDAFLLRAYLIVKKGATALNNTAQAVFHPAGKFGAGGSGGGSGGNGDVIGAASSTTDAIVRYADPSGKLIKNSTVILSDGGSLTGIYNLTATNQITTPTILTNTVAHSTGLSSITMGLGTITMDVPLAMSNSKITGLATPTLNNDASTKSYVDSAKAYIDLTPTTTPTLVEGRIYYDALVDNLVYAKNNNWYQITSSIYYPINPANLRGWFDASNPSSISQSAGNVTVWNDVSGNGFNLTGITSTPRTGDTTFNSKNVVNLDGSEVIYRSADTINYTTHTIVMVCSTTVNKDLYGSGSTGDGHVLLTITGDKFRGHYWKGVVGNIFDSSYIANTAMSIRVIRVSTTTMDLIENGNTKKNSFIISGTSSGTSKGIYIGFRSAAPGSSGLNGSVAEVLVFNTNLSDTDLNNVGNNLAIKWGLTWTNINNTYAAISTPIFTASTTGNFTATASSENPAGGPLYAWHTFNQNTGTPGWASNSSTYSGGNATGGSLGGFTGSWVKLRILTPVLVSSLNFTTNISTEEPKRWIVLYSDDDITWNTADSANNASDFNSYSPGTGVSSTGIIFFPSPVTCRYIAIVITKNAGAVNTAIREIYYA